VWGNDSFDENPINPGYYSGLDNFSWLGETKHSELMMMQIRGQGAMEYLMTYGWAILVVMIIGVSLWKLGIFNLGGSVPPTASGFGAIKPMLSTCQAGTPIWQAGPDIFFGFECQFINVAGTDIRLKDFKITVNNEVCSVQVAQNIPQDIPNHVGRMLYTTCGTVIPASCSSSFCANYYDGFNMLPCGAPPVGDGSFIPIRKDGSIFAAIYRHVSVPAENWGLCGPGYHSGGVYSINFDFTYDVDVGGMSVTKHSTGTVHMVA